MQGVEASKMRVKCPDDVALEQKEKELTGLVHSFLWLSKSPQQALLGVPVEEQERASLKPFRSHIFQKGGLEADILMVRMAIDSRIKALQRKKCQREIQNRS